MSKQEKPELSPKNRSLDGLRGLTIAGVLLHHSHAPGTQAGWLCVDLFFVLSGFLITTLLLKEQERSGGINLDAFWVRRLLRLMPVYWLYLLSVTAVLVYDRNGPNFNVQAGWSWWQYIGAYWVYIGNYVPLGGIWSKQFFTGHLWSLSVEEQFYFAWPCLVLFAARKRCLEVIAWLCVLGCLVAVLVSVHPSACELPTRGMGLFIGSAVAVSAQQRSELFKRWRVISPAALKLTGVALVANYMVASFPSKALIEPISASLSSVVPSFDLTAGILLANLWHAEPSADSSLLSARPLTELGRVSYSAYVYHYAVLKFVWDVLLPGISEWPAYPKFALRAGVYLLLTFGLAFISYRLVESPFLKLKERTR